MTDFHVVAVVTAKAGSEKLVGEALSALVGPTRAEEGCICYQIFVSAADPAIFVALEIWRS